MIVCVNTLPHGVFSVAWEAVKFMAEGGHAGAIYEYAKGPGWGPEALYGRYLARDDAALIRAVKKLRHAADGPQALLKLVEIPDNASWVIRRHPDSGVEFIDVLDTSGTLAAFAAAAGAASDTPKYTTLKGTTLKGASPMPMDEKDRIPGIHTNMTDQDPPPPARRPEEQHSVVVNHGDSADSEVVYNVRRPEAEALENLVTRIDELEELVQLAGDILSEQSVFAEYQARNQKTHSGEKEFRAAALELRTLSNKFRSAVKHRLEQHILQTIEETTAKASLQGRGEKDHNKGDF